MRASSLTLCLGLLLAVGAPLSAQAPPPVPVDGQTFHDELEVVVVNVDVYVRNRRGEPVTNLGRDEFRILQDGMERPLSHFAALTEEAFAQGSASTPVLVLPEPTPAPTAGPMERPEQRPVFVVLYVDNENVEPLDRNRVMRRVREFVTANLRPPIQMMVLSYERSLKVKHPFTDDPAAVNAALRGLEKNTGGLTEREATRRDILDHMTEAVDRSSDRGQTGGQSGERKVYAEVLRYAEEEANDLAFSLGALREAVTMLSGVEGRKSIIYVSSGLPMTPGLGLMQEYASRFRDSSILSQRGRFEHSRDYTSLTAAANGQNVSLYTIDVRGLEVGIGGSAEQRYSRDPTAASVGRNNYQDSLRFLADNTGGLAVLNTNDVTAGLERIRADLFTYYSLAYTINPSGQDRVHRIEVQVPAHPDYVLRYRERFVERSLESQVQDRVMTALVLDVDANPLDVRLQVGTPAPVAGTRWTVPVSVSLPLEKLALIPEGDELVGRLVLFAAARDRGGQQSDLQRQEHQVRVPAAQGTSLEGRRWRIEVPFLMEEGSHRVAVGVMDQVTQAASFERVEVKVP